MPPKGPNKKDLEKQKQKIVEDKTFGLKNKSKSKKVQQYVHHVNQQADQQVQQKIMGANKSRAQLEAEAARHQSKKELLEARLKELEILGQQVVDDSKKPKSKEQLAKEEEERRRREEEEERRRIALLPVEDQIEIERERIVTKTPVTLELFLEWKKKKAEDRIKKNSEFRAKRTRNLSKAEKAKGVGMTGKDLFAFNAQVFVDDDEAVVDKFERDESYVSEEEEQEQQSGAYLGGEDDGTKNDEENEPADQVDSSAFENMDIKEDENQEQAVEADESLFG